MSSMNFEVPGGEQYHMDVSGLYGGLVQMKEKYAGQLKVRVGAELGQPQVNPERRRFLSGIMVMCWILSSVYLFHNMENRSGCLLL